MSYQLEEKLKNLQSAISSLQHDTAKYTDGSDKVLFGVIQSINNGNDSGETCCAWCNVVRMQPEQYDKLGRPHFLDYDYSGSAVPDDPVEKSDGGGVAHYDKVYLCNAPPSYCYLFFKPGQVIKYWSYKGVGNNWIQQWNFVTLVDDLSFWGGVSNTSATSYVFTAINYNPSYTNTQTTFPNWSTACGSNTLSEPCKNIETLYNGAFGSELPAYISGTANCRIYPMLKNTGTNTYEWDYYFWYEPSKDVVVNITGTVGGGLYSLDVYQGTSTVAVGDNLSMPNGLTFITSNAIGANLNENGSTNALCSGWFNGISWGTQNDGVDKITFNATPPCQTNYAVVPGYTNGQIVGTWSATNTNSNPESLGTNTGGAGTHILTVPMATNVSNLENSNGQSYFSFMSRFAYSATNGLLGFYRTEEFNCGVLEEISPEQVITIIPPCNTSTNQTSYYIGSWDPSNQSINPEVGGGGGTTDKLTPGPGGTNVDNIETMQNVVFFSFMTRITYSTNTTNLVAFYRTMTFQCGLLTGISPESSITIDPTVICVP